MPSQTAAELVAVARQRIENQAVDQAVAETLQQMGYGNVAQLDGGCNAWKAAGQPVITTLT